MSDLRGMALNEAECELLIEQRRQYRREYDAKWALAVSFIEMDKLREAQKRRKEMRSVEGEGDRVFVL